MLRRLFDNPVLSVLWRIYSSAAGVLLAAGIITYLWFDYATPSSGSPVVIVEKFELMTPRVPVGGSFSFRVWRKSTESCPGAGVVAFTRIMEGNSGATAVVSVRYPLGTPGHNSPPPLVITREVPPLITPGKWHVRTGVDSFCPTRNQYDATGEFELEVYDVK